VAPHAYLVERLAGDRVDVLVMLPAGASPLLYEPTLTQLRDLSEASLYVKVGHPRFPFEHAWLETLLEERPGLPVIDASARLRSEGDDPHVWLVPENARSLAGDLAAALAELLPDAADAIETKRMALDLDLQALDTELRTILEPARGERFLVLHPAWGHLAREYGLVQVAIEPDHKEPGVRELAILIDHVQGLRTVFVQPQLDPASARVVADELGAQVEVLDPLAENWDANLRHAARRIAEAAG
jgi:zinc transport system substrate-binding protein